MCHHDVHSIVMEVYRVQGRLFTPNFLQEHEWTRSVCIAASDTLADARRLVRLHASGPLNWAYSVSVPPVPATPVRTVNPARNNDRSFSKLLRLNVIAMWLSSSHLDAC